MLNTVLVDPELLQVDTLVEAAYASNFVCAQKELLEHGQSIKLPNCLNFIASQPYFLQEATLFEALDLRHSLIHNVELLKVREVRQPVHPVNVIQAKVYCLDTRHVLLVYT